MYIIILGILLIASGALAAAAFIVAKRPDAKAAIDKLVPSQAIIGLITAAWGLLSLFLAMRDWSAWGDVVNLGKLVGADVPSRSLWFLIVLLGSILGVVLGLFLGYGLIAKKMAGSSPEAAAKGEALRLKLVKYQTPLGIAAVVLGLLSIVAYFIIRSAPSIGVPKIG